MNPDHKSSTKITYTLRYRPYHEHGNHHGEDLFVKFCSYEGEDHVEVDHRPELPPLAGHSPTMHLTKEEGRKIWHELISEGYVLHSTDRSGSKNACSIFAKTLEDISLNHFKEDVYNHYKDYTFQKEKEDWDKGKMIDYYSCGLLTVYEKVA